MAHLNTLPIAPSEARNEDPIFLVLATYAHTGTDDAWLQAQAAVQSLRTLESAQSVFDVLEEVYRRAQKAVPPTPETTLERHRAVLEALQARASHLQAREQARQLVAQRERDNAEESTQSSAQRDAQDARLRTLRAGPDSNGVESALLAAADRYDLDRAAALIDAIGSTDALNRTFEASLIVLETSGDAVQQRSHALLQEMLRERMRELDSVAAEQQSQQASLSSSDASEKTRSLTAEQETVKAMLQSKLDSAAMATDSNSNDTKKTPVVIKTTEGGSWSGSLSRLPCWLVFLGGVVVLALFVALVSFVSGVVSRNRANKKQKELEQQQQQRNALLYNLQQQQRL